MCAGVHLGKVLDLYTGVGVGMCVDVCGSFMYMCTDMCVDMCMDMRMDMGTDVRGSLCTDDFTAGFTCISTDVHTCAQARLLVPHNGSNGQPSSTPPRPRPPQQQQLKVDSEVLG